MLFLFSSTEYPAILSFDYTGANQCFSGFYNSPDGNIDSRYPMMTGSLLIRQIGIAYFIYKNVVWILII